MARLRLFLAGLLPNKAYLKGRATLKLKKKRIKCGTGNTERHRTRTKDSESWSQVGTIRSLSTATSDFIGDNCFQVSVVHELLEQNKKLKQ